jgi:hypothetical protein
MREDRQPERRLASVDMLNGLPEPTATLTSMKSKDVIDQAEAVVLAPGLPADGVGIKNVPE